MSNSSYSNPKPKRLGWQHANLVAGMVFNGRNRATRRRDEKLFRGAKMADRIYRINQGILKTKKHKVAAFLKRMSEKK